MPIRTCCPSCRTDYTLADNMAGKTVRCKQCSETFPVRSAKASAKVEAEQVQTHANGPRRSPARSEEEPSSARRRNREEEVDVRRLHSRGNRGVMIALIACGIGLLLLLAGGIAAVVYLLGDRSGNFGIADSSWPAVEAPPGARDFAVLHIAGIVDPATREDVSDRLSALAQANNCSVTFKGQGDRMTAVFTPVWDVQAFSQQVNFGTVDSVKDRIITVTARKTEAPPPNADAVTRALNQLKSPALHKRQEGARNLQHMLPDDRRRAEVVKALEPLLNADDPFTRRSAIETICVWANKDSVPVLLNALQAGEDFVIRGEVIKALGRLKDERAIEPIAERLGEFAERQAAEQALAAMGPMAEKAVVARLNHPDWQVRQSACEILTRIGTKQSLPALEKVAEEGKDIGSGFNHFVTQKAEAAIRAIKARR